MTHQQTLAALVPAAYLLGSVPFGLVVGLSKGVDVRKAGSGNIGATNVGRLLGKRFFFLVFILDMLKGLIPMLLAAAIARQSPGSQTTYELVLLVGFAAILGHMFSVFLRFKGGKGVATSAGVVLGLWPYYTLAGALAIGAFIITVFITRYISVGSIVAAGVFPVAYLAIGLAREWDPLGRQLPLLVFAVLVAGMIVYKHRSNIARLRAGTESRLGSKQPPLAA
jgi:glycerol-3-phosphate acyltransferase PlsY